MIICQTQTGRYGSNLFSTTIFRGAVDRLRQGPASGLARTSTNGFFYYENGAGFWAAKHFVVKSMERLLPLPPHRGVMLRHCCANVWIRTTTVPLFGVEQRQQRSTVATLGRPSTEHPTRQHPVCKTNAL